MPRAPPPTHAIRAPTCGVSGVHLVCGVGVSSLGRMHTAHKMPGTLPTRAACTMQTPLPPPHTRTMQPTPPIPTTRTIQTPATHTHACRRNHTTPTRHTHNTNHTTPTRHTHNTNHTTPTRHTPTYVTDTHHTRQTGAGISTKRLKDLQNNALRGPQVPDQPRSSPSKTPAPTCPPPFHHHERLPPRLLSPNPCFVAYNCPLPVGDRPIIHE